MTLREAILQIDRIKPNRFSDEDKAQWLSELDGKIFIEIVETHQRPSYLAGVMRFDAYIAGRDDELQLLAPNPHDVVYRWWLECQIDIANNEIAKYNNSRTLFANAYAELQAWWNRMYVPIGPVTRFGFTGGYAGNPTAETVCEVKELKAKDIQNALGYIPEQQGAATTMGTAVRAELTEEKGLRASGDTNAIASAKAYTDSKVNSATIDIYQEVNDELTEMATTVATQIAAVGANAGTALDMATTAAAKADAAKTSADTASSSAQQCVSIAQNANNAAQAAKSAAAISAAAAETLKDGTVVANVLKSDSVFKAAVKGEKGDPGEDGDPGSDAEVTESNINAALGVDLKAVLNQKQDVISDLSTIRSGAAAGATALQSVPVDGVKNALISDAMVLTDDQKSSACATFGAYRKPTDGWVLKGTLTADTPYATLDLSGCTELYFCGLATATGLCSINANSGGYTLIDSIIANGTRRFYATFRTFLFGLESVSCKYTNNSTNTYLPSTGSAYSRTNLMVEQINRIAVTNSSNLTSCDIKIYAR